MKGICRHCGKPIEWDNYWSTWDHVGRDRKLTAELCNPELGWNKSKKASR